jgi:hypothetical protein
LRAALVKDEAWVTVQGVPDRPGAASTIFSKIAGRKVAMDMIVQNVAAEGHADISFSVYRDDLARTLKAVEEACKELGSGTYTCDDSVSKVSVVGLGMESQTGVAEKMFRALGREGDQSTDDHHQRDQDLRAGRAANMRSMPCERSMKRSTSPTHRTNGETAETEEPLADADREQALARLRAVWKI